MKRKMIISVLAVMISVFTLANPVLAKAEKWEIDPAHSSIYFDIRHIYSTVRGMFTDFSGTLIFDPDNKDASSVEFSVKVDSINTHITKRDNHLRSNDFFEADKYPLMTFKSTGVKQVKDNRYLLAGNLTVKDVTKAVEIPFTYYGLRENPLKAGQMVAGFEAEFTIDRLDYHVGSEKFTDMGVLGKEVHVLVTLEVLKEISQ
ncbi:MAG: YceI family protein [Desulfosalsimonadaceae bacterium]